MERCSPCHSSGHAALTEISDLRGDGFRKEKGSILGRMVH